MSKSYNIYLPAKKMVKNFKGQKLTLSIGKIKSREFCVVTPYFIFFDTDEKEVFRATLMESYLVTPSYSKIVTTIDFAHDLTNLMYYQVMLKVEGVHSNNPVQFTELMVNEGEPVDYIKPDEDVGESTVEFVNNFYALYYSTNLKGSLQIIRPNYDRITTENLLRSKCTVLAPHLNNELNPDKPENIGLEYMNMTEQTIELVR